MRGAQVSVERGAAPAMPFRREQAVQRLAVSPPCGKRLRLGEKQIRILVAIDKRAIDYGERIRELACLSI